MAMSEKERMARELMAADFTVYDMVLFLDTHPNDQKMLMQYRNAVNHAKNVREAYEKKYGPLTVQSAGMGSHWNWIKGPWPWENY